MTELEERIMDTASDILGSFGHLHDADCLELFELYFSETVPEWITPIVKVQIISSLRYLRRFLQSY